MKEFLAIRGLTLSAEKTKISYIRDGFDFLGQNFRKYGGKLCIKPCKTTISEVIRKAGGTIRKYGSSEMSGLIKRLNRVLRGWANYHRHVVSSKAFGRIDFYVYHQLWRMIRRRHSDKSSGWLASKYWRRTGKSWIFSATVKRNVRIHTYHVVRMSSIGIKRHKKVIGNANPYKPEFSKYFWERRNNKESCFMTEQSSRQQRLALPNDGQLSGSPTRAAFGNA